METFKPTNIDTDKALEFLNRSQPKKTPIVKCTQCHKLYAVNLEHRHKDNLVEYGSHCQHCKTWHSLGYFTAELIQRRSQIRSKRQLRAFKRDYEKLQKEVLTELS